MIGAPIEDEDGGGVTISVHCSRCGFVAYETVFTSERAARTVNRLKARHAGGCKRKPIVRNPYAEDHARQESDAKH